MNLTGKQMQSCVMIRKIIWENKAMRCRGFTLLESALTIVIAAAIITMAVASFNSIQTQKKIAETQSELNTLYQAALKAPNLAVSCTIGQPCLGLSSAMFTNPWQQTNSVTIENTQIVLRTTLPNNDICKALLERFSSVQTDADKASKTGNNTCTRSSSNANEKNLEVRISLYQS